MGIGAFGIGPASKFATELQTRAKSRTPARPLFRFSGGRAALGLESGILSGADELIDCGGNRCVYELRTHRSLNKDAPIHRAIQQWAASYLRPSSVAFITTIAESSFQYTQAVPKRGKNDIWSSPIEHRSLTPPAGRHSSC
jgi:hypothetical protein